MLSFKQQIFSKENQNKKIQPLPYMVKRKHRFLFDFCWKYFVLGIKKDAIRILSFDGIFSDIHISSLN